MRNGRVSWPIFLALLYSTLVVVGTDLAWRLLAGPVIMFAGGGLVALILGNAAIFFLSRRTQ